MVNCILLKQYLFITTVLFQLETALTSSKFLIIKSVTTEGQGHPDTPTIGIISTICYKHHSLQHIILQSLTIKEIITSKLQMFYKFCSILINWKTARQTNVWQLFKAFVFSLIWLKYIFKKRKCLEHLLSNWI